VPSPLLDRAAAAGCGMSGNGALAEPRTLCCPICGREMGIPGHRPQQPWTPQQVAMIRKMWAIGLQHKQIAWLFGPRVTARAIGSLLRTGAAA